MVCLFSRRGENSMVGRFAIGYLEACLPLLRDLGLTRHEGLAREQLDAGAADACLLGEGRAGLWP
jgi:hypothetical protein